MRILIAAALLAGSVLPASILPAWAGYGDTITPTQALANVGLCMTVEGHATISPAVGRLGLQLTLDDGNGKLNGYIPTPDSIPDLNSLDGQTVDLTGVIQMNYGLPEIMVNQPYLVGAAGAHPDFLLTCQDAG